MGTAVGDDGGTNQTGVAPGAKWIGCRNMNQGDGTPARYMECFEFFLAPYPVGGTPAQGDPTKAPDVTTNSWSCPTSEGCSALTLQAGVEAQRNAGIMMVVAAQNSGPGCSTVLDPPGIYDAAYSIGALNTGTDTIASFSSRGPVTADGSNRMKPDISAPGTSTRSSYNTSDTAYASLSGTSMATPHVAGAVALLWSERPTLRHDVTATENILNDSAVHISSTACSSSGSPNNTYGYGRIDVLAAVNHLLLTGAVSRKTHGAAGTFDIPLPLNGDPGVECRGTDGNYMLVFTFDNNLMSGNAIVTSGTGSVAGSPTFSANTMTVNLTGVTNAQKISVKLTGVTDTQAQTLADTIVSMNVLSGDSTGNKSVNASDVSQIKAQSGASGDGDKFPHRHQRQRLDQRFGRQPRQIALRHERALTRAALSELHGRSDSRTRFSVVRYFSLIILLVAVSAAAFPRTADATIPGNFQQIDCDGGGWLSKSFRTVPVAFTGEPTSAGCIAATITVTPGISSAVTCRIWRPTSSKALPSLRGTPMSFIKQPELPTPTPILAAVFGKASMGNDVDPCFSER